MNLDTSLTVAAKELKVLRRKKSIIYSIIVLPLLLSVLFSLFVYNEATAASGVPTSLDLGLDSLTYFFVVLAATLPGSIAAYSIVGEKVEKSLEPLLATPATDGEILLGKSIAAFVPPILASGQELQSSWRQRITQRTTCYPTIIFPIGLLESCCFSSLLLRRYSVSNWQ